MLFRKSDFVKHVYSTRDQVLIYETKVFRFRVHILLKYEKKVTSLIFIPFSKHAIGRDTIVKFYKFLLRDEYPSNFILFYRHCIDVQHLNSD